MIFFTALGLFLYQSLDAIDGKQARRTKSSSPLGELFDHGCDSVSTGLFLQRKSRTTEEINFIRNNCLFSICHRRYVLCCTTWFETMADVLVLYAYFYCLLLRTLANLRVRKTAIWKVSCCFC